MAKCGTAPNRLMPIFLPFKSSTRSISGRVISEMVSGVVADTEMTSPPRSTFEMIAGPAKPAKIGRAGQHGLKNER